MKEDIDAEAEEIADAVFGGLPEYPEHVTRKVGDRYSAYSRVGDTAFRGDSTEGFPDAIADLSAQVEMWRARHR